MTKKDLKAAIKGLVTVSQHNLPALEAGEYELSVAQEVLALPKTSQGKKAQETFQNKVTFAVRGERFRLTPGDLHSLFPPENADGEFANVLPHAVFRRRTLPWERSPRRQKPELGPKDDVPTWLAILLFDQQDATASFDLKPKPATVSDFFKGPGLARGRSYFDAVPPGKTPPQALDYGETPEDPCLALDVPLELFRAVAPSLEDLKLLAHSRTVSMENQEQDLAELIEREKELPEDLSPEDDFSVVFCNRLPSPGRRCTAHLVSLEGLEEHLPGGAQSARPEQDGEFLRLAVLKSWSFAAADVDAGKRAFVEKLKGLNRDESPNWLRLPVKEPVAGDAGARARAKAALELGYVGVNHELRGGGRTVSWYRGPLLPYRKRGSVLDGPITSADAATRYDPDTGLLDASYSSAWQLGRLLALQDRAFSTALYLWKRKNERALAARIEARIARGFFGAIEAAGGAAQPLQGVMDLLARTLAPDAKKETR